MTITLTRRGFEPDCHAIEFRLCDKQASCTLSLHGLYGTLTLLEQEHVIPSLPENWIYRLENFYRPDLPPLRPVKSGRCREERRLKLKTQQEVAMVAHVRENFDHIVTTLRHDLGVNFSDDAAARMLRDWYRGRGYLHRNATIRNLPWMIPYLSTPLQLYGQKGFSSPLKAAIKAACPRAVFDRDGVLRSRGRWVDLSLQCLHHKVRDEGGDQPGEALTVRIMDMTHTNCAIDAPVIFLKVFAFDFARYQDLVSTTDVARDTSLLEIAQRILGGSATHETREAPGPSADADANASASVSKESVLDCLRLATQEGIVPPLPDTWWEQNSSLRSDASVREADEEKKGR